MVKVLGRFTAAHPWKICAAWLGVAVFLALVAPNWDTRTQDDDIHFLPKRCDSVRGYQLLEKAFPQDVFASKAILAVERPGELLTDSDFELIDQCVADLVQLRDREPELGIGKIVSHRDPF